MKNLKFILLFCFALCLTNCSSGPLTESDNNSTLEYQLDSPFQIQLEGDTNSENEWRLTYNIEPIISLKSQSKQPKDGKSMYTFNFKVESEGEKDIVLVYGTDGNVLKTFQIKVIAGTMGRILTE